MVQLCVECRLARFDAAVVAAENAVRLCEIVGADRTGLLVAANLVQIRLEKGDIDGAISAGRDLTARLRETYYPDTLGFVLGILSAALIERGDLDEALTSAKGSRTAPP
jgi:hypothetical protein